MKTKATVLIFILLTLFSSCKKAEKNQPQATKESPVELLDRGNFWSYRHSDIFADGGSVILGFINGNGEVIYVWFDFSITGSEFKYRRCFLQTSYNDPDAVEIPMGSNLETKVIKLIESARGHELTEKYMPSRAKAVEILKSRDMHLRLVGKAVVVPPSPNAVPIPDLEVPDPTSDLE